MRVFSWNPRKPVIPGRFGSFVPIRRRPNNFGDLLGPLIVGRLLEQAALLPKSSRFAGQLLTVGSVLHFARPGDVVWGTGINGKIQFDYKSIFPLSIRAVRGPRTRSLLLDAGFDAPALYGDPGLLLPLLFPKEIEQAKAKAQRRALTIIPNLNDLGSKEVRNDKRVVRPTESFWHVIGSIAVSDFVVGSSLHALVIADALGVPNRRLASRFEAELKYADFYEGSGRQLPAGADSVNEALRMGPSPKIDWDGDSLLRAFPYDLWKA
jgi:pyruvyltransferase